MRRKISLVWLKSFVLVFALQSIAITQPSQSPAGDWILNLGQRTLIILALRNTASKDQPFSGSLSRPQRFQTRDGASFSHIEGGVSVQPLVASEWKGSALSITVQNPANPTDKEAYLLTLKDATHAQLQIAGIPLPPINLTLANGTPSIATDWDSRKTYSPDDNAQSNTEMKRIFVEDQSVRQPGLSIDWISVGKSDAERRLSTINLLNAGALHTGEDFTWAAFIFQHGATSNDYLLAHTLALVAVKKGNGDALWIATATLDRYLQSIKQPQIYGTQFPTPKGLPTTQEPYDRDVISDSLRQELGVPPLAAQEVQRQKYDVERKLVQPVRRQL
jgi:hypothetical protein